MLALFPVLLFLWGTALAKSCTRNPCMSALQASPADASYFCSALIQTLSATTSTTTIRSTSTSTETEYVTATGKAPGHVTTTTTVFKGARETVTIDVTSFARPTDVFITTLVDVTPGSTVTQVVTMTLESKQTVPVTVTQTLVESSTTTLTQTSVSTIFETEFSTATISSTAQTDTVTNSISTTVSDVSSTTSFGVTVTTDIPTATATTTVLDVSTSTQVVTATVVLTEFVSTETITSFTSTEVTFVATSTVTVTQSPSAKKRQLNERATFPYNFPGCNATAASQACHSMGLGTAQTGPQGSYLLGKVLHTVRLVAVVKKKVRCVIYPQGANPEVSTTTKTVSNSRTATVTRTLTVTGGHASTSTVRSRSTLPGATLSSTLSVSNVKTISETTTATESTTVIGTADTTVTVSTIVPTTIVATSTVLITITSTIDQTLTSTVSVTTTIESADATLTVTEFVTATETATSFSATTIENTSTTSSTISLTSSTTISIVTTASSTLVTSCQLGETKPTPNAVLNPGFESNSDGQPWSFSIRSVNTYTGSFAVATSAPAVAGCQVGAITITTSVNSVVGGTASIRQTVSTTPGKTYQVGLSYRVRLPPGVTTPNGLMSGFFGSEDIRIPAPTVAWKTYSTPVVAYNQTTLFVLQYYLNAPTKGTYMLLIDEVFVTEVEDNPTLISNGAFDNSPSDFNPWISSGAGTFSVRPSGVIFSPPNAGCATLSLNAPVPSSAPQTERIQQPITLVPGIKYKATLVYSAQATYQFQNGGNGQGLNGARVGIQYPEASSDGSVVIQSVVSPTGGGTYTATFTALHEQGNWYWEAYSSFVNANAAASTFQGTINVYVDNLYVKLYPEHLAWEIQELVDYQSGFPKTYVD
ncbi:hypothetical protein BJ170DRAFT_679168 [Xylariales sp. AK1849]|nr:hypothetical protein BJ170DRAFT_679168 [Xylariales sp. AK1849]